jgi:hypothetical protein
MTATASGTQTLSTALHPIRHWFGINAFCRSIRYGLALTFANCWPVEIFLTMGESQTNGFNMAFETIRTPSREFV